ncbi:MAG: aminotransferase class I/II-fold pyridoxal phosphate-dependent enzyme [Spirochaetaceae bacterium]|nr:aminotransferase class I/II-fold pyridoxal phosphate-dependent enzyme [Spirochaetaceae bacterium]
MELAAKEVNKILENCVIHDLLSQAGKRLFYPKGIISQAAEAKEKAKKYDATIGMATEGNMPMFLPTMMKYFNDLKPSEIFNYASAEGNATLRKLWKEEMLKKNPSIEKNKIISHPIVTAGITHGISILADMFIEKGDNVIVPDMYWGNYKYIVETMKEAHIKNFPFYDNDSLNLKALENIIRASDSRKVSVVLNFPNNPTGYSPSLKEVDQIASMLKKLAKENYKILAICDDAYFGLFFEDDTFKESVFSKLCDLDENILAVKLDGATKEELAWGFRVGFITYGGKGITEEQYKALEHKTTGAIRATVSNCNAASQNLLVKALSNPEYHNEKNAAFKKMEARYLKVKEVLAKMPADVPMRVLPFNSGYFMAFELLGKDAEKLRMHLLDNYSIGTISIGSKYLRIAFSSVTLENIPDLYDTIFKAVKELNS